MSTVPNWCHNSLTVTGEETALQAFVEQVETSEQPLSFEKITPRPSEEEMRQRETYKPCTMCGAHGTLPESLIQAAERGARWYDWMDPATRSNRTCNVCSGTKQERAGMEGWYTWSIENWGTKWDASFSDSMSMFAIGAESMDVEVTKETQKRTLTPTVAIYKFDTAWSPPAPVIRAASAQNPELEFVLRFGEVGEGYAGEIKYVAGVVISEEEMEIEDVLAPEEMWY